MSWTAIDTERAPGPERLQPDPSPLMTLASDRLFGPEAVRPDLAQKTVVAAR